MDRGRHRPGRVLIVAGSDSGGGAGIQADIKTVTALGGYAATAVTALTAQNTQGVFDVLPIEPAFVAAQMRLVLTDIGADVIKTGMFYSADVIQAVVEQCRGYAAGVPIVVDPVMVAKDSSRLLQQQAQRALVERLVPLAALLTPNAPEAEALTGLSVRHVDDLGPAADRLLTLGPAAVLVKGGHLTGETVVDLLRTADGYERRFESPRVATTSTHGTGCTLASAIAVGIAEGLRLEDAVDRARRYVFEAIRCAPGFGQGHGPLYHAHTVRPEWTTNQADRRARDE
jgi:hydroxymethylpyrimidine/phosphomethylpyrimidine kinase